MTHAELKAEMMKKRSATDFHTHENGNILYSFHEIERLATDAYIASLIETVRKCAKRIEAQSDLLVSYRLGKRPTEKTFNHMSASDDAMDIAKSALQEPRA